jgi:hypothetical protein
MQMKELVLDSAFNVTEIQLVSSTVNIACFDKANREFTIISFRTYEILNVSMICLCSVPPLRGMGHTYCI